MKGHGTMTRLLMIEDDRALAEMVATYLGRAGMALDHRESTEAGLAAALQGGYDAVILDLMLPDGDGLEVCRAIRARSDVPILMLTARGEEADRIVGLEIGADDYLPKPFNPRELLARLRAILRRRRRVMVGNRPCGGGRDHALRPSHHRPRGATDTGRWRGAAAYRPPVRPPLRAGGERWPRAQPRAALWTGCAARRWRPSTAASMCISRGFRAAIEDDPKNPRRIVTLRGAGYLFTRSQDEDA